jgi:predicted lysophospholipase L1 biosynthesis ABC-type transport system permease subunit
VCQERSAADATDQTVDAVGLLCTFRIVLSGRPLQVMGFGSFRGSITPTIVAGRAPRRADEVALGAKTLEALGRQIGDVVSAREPDGGRRRYEIVGQAVLPPVGEIALVSEGAAFTAAGLDRLDPGSDSDTLAAYLLRFRPGVDQPAATRRFERAGAQVSMGAPRVPDDIERLQDVDALPPVLGGLMVLLALLAVGHTLVTGVRRRRRELAVLKTIGFTRRQVFSTIAWNASTIALLGGLVGIPLGLAVGRVAWGLVADSLGVATDPVIGALAIIAVVPAALVVANVVAVLPARAAARTRPATVLRSE